MTRRGASSPGIADELVAEGYAAAGYTCELTRKLLTRMTTGFSMTDCVYTGVDVDDSFLAKRDPTLTP